MILIAYDGSVHSDYAISVAGSLLHGGRARVLYAWDPVADPAELSFDRSAEHRSTDDQTARAVSIAEAGAELARLEGFEVEAEAVRTANPAQAIEEAAAQLRPDLVVLGSRGLRGLQAVLMGSVSRHVERHVRAPVLIVPPARLEPTAM